MSELCDLLECSVCLEPLGRRHKVLPCQHTFCVACLEDIVAKNSGQLLCPECRCQVDVSVDKLPSNVILNRILETLATPSPPPATSSSPPPPIPPPTSCTGRRNPPLPPPLPSRPAAVAAPPRDVAADIPGNLATNPFLAPSLAPKADIYPLPAPKLPPKQTHTAPNRSSRNQHPASSNRAPAAGQNTDRPQNGPHQVYRALYDYRPVKGDELALVKGQLYFVMEKCEDGWFKGSSLQTLKTGVFPGNYVQHVQYERPSSANRDTNATDLIDFSDLSDLFSTDKSIVPPNMTSTCLSSSSSCLSLSSAALGLTQEQNKPPAAASSAQIGSGGKGSEGIVSVSQRHHKKARYKAIMAFPASSRFELDLKEGDVVLMIKCRDDGWCKGTLERSGQTGLFPLSFVQKLVTTAICVDPSTDGSWLAALPAHQGPILNNLVGLALWPRKRNTCGQGSKEAKWPVAPSAISFMWPVKRVVSMSTENHSGFSARSIDSTKDMRMLPTTRIDVPRKPRGLNLILWASVVSVIVGIAFLLLGSAWFWKKESDKLMELEEALQHQAHDIDQIQQALGSGKSQPPAVSSVCSLTKETGPCRASMPKFYFDTVTGRCQPFIYGGCNGNENNFASLDDCKASCSKEICHLGLLPGTCRARIPRFYFNSKTSQCELFFYEGCDGNLNNFPDQESCQQMCQ